jgi:hypothetical protein
MTSTHTTQITLKTRTKAPYAIVYLGSERIKPSVVGYAYSHSAAATRLRREANHGNRNLDMLPVVNGMVSFLGTLPGTQGPAEAPVSPVQPSQPTTVVMAPLFPGEAPVEAPVIVVPGVEEAHEDVKATLQAAFGPAFQVTHVSHKLADMLGWLKAHPGKTVADYQANQA